MSHHDPYYRQPWMSEDQWDCACLLADLVGGFHHMPGTIKPCWRGIECNARHFHASTWDFNLLTRFVVLAHDRCIRAEIAPSGPGLLRLVLHKRAGRSGGMAQRHPSLEHHIACIRAGQRVTEEATATEEAPS